MSRDRTTAKRYLTGELTGGERPSAVGEKFQVDGVVMPFPGNTFICHIDQASVAHAALSAAQQRLSDGPFHRSFSFLPPSSFHMTVFEGVTNLARSAPEWPRTLPSDAPVSAVTGAFAVATEGLALPRDISIKLDNIFGGFSVSVSGATDEEEHRLRVARASLREATGIHKPDFDTYGFHITLGYLLRWLDPDEAELVLDLSDEVAKALIDTLPTMTLKEVTLCTFDDMHAFVPVRRF